MSKASVSKVTYFFWTIIFHSLCLSGLVWQVVQISVNFFKFDVMKDINVITPDEIDSAAKVLYVCVSKIANLDPNIASEVHNSKDGGSYVNISGTIKLEDDVTVGELFTVVQQFESNFMVLINQKIIISMNS